MSSEDQAQSRAVDVSIEIDAPADAVWRALTDGNELSRWFSPVARVEPGPGGSVFMSWGDGIEGTGVIEVWEPNRALRISEASGLAVDYFIQARGDATVLRVVHSGFGADAAFDDQFEGTSEGWRYFLFNLKHYLERHAAQPRHMISARVPMEISREDAWGRLLGAQGLQLSPNPVQPGEHFHIRLGGQQYSGRVVSYRPSRSFAAIVKELNDGLLFIELEAGMGTWHCGFWLSVYGPQPEVGGLRAALAELAQNAARPGSQLVR